MTNIFKGITKEREEILKNNLFYRIVMRSK